MTPMCLSVAVDKSSMVRVQWSDKTGQEFASMSDLCAWAGDVLADPSLAKRIALAQWATSIDADPRAMAGKRADTIQAISDVAEASVMVAKDEGAWLL